MSNEIGKPPTIRDTVQEMRDEYDGIINEFDAWLASVTKAREAHADEFKPSEPSVEPAIRQAREILARMRGEADKLLVQLS